MSSVASNKSSEMEDEVIFKCRKCCGVYLKKAELPEHRMMHKKEKTANQRSRHGNGSSERILADVSGHEQETEVINGTDAAGSPNGIQLETLEPKDPPKEAAILEEEGLDRTRKLKLSTKENKRDVAEGSSVRFRSEKKYDDEIIGSWVRGEGA